MFKLIQKILLLKNRMKVYEDAIGSLDRLYTAALNSEYSDQKYQTASDEMALLDLYGSEEIIVSVRACLAHLRLLSGEEFYKDPDKWNLTYLKLFRDMVRWMREDLKV